jgi:hypothetical protein
MVTAAAPLLAVVLVVLPAGLAVTAGGGGGGAIGSSSLGPGGGVLSLGLHQLEALHVDGGRGVGDVDRCSTGWASSLWSGRHLWAGGTAREVQSA